MEQDIYMDYSSLLYHKTKFYTFIYQKIIKRYQKDDKIQINNNEEW